MTGNLWAAIVGILRLNLGYPPESNDWFDSEPWQIWHYRRFPKWGWADINASISHARSPWLEYARWMDPDIPF